MPVFQQPFFCFFDSETQQRYLIKHETSKHIPSHFLKKLLKIRKKNVFIINNKKNLGKSKSIINTIRKIKTKNIILIDCDLPYLLYLKKVINSLKKNDLVLVNRKMKNSKKIGKNN